MGLQVGLELQPAMLDRLRALADIEAAQSMSASRGAGGRRGDPTPFPTLTQNRRRVHGLHAAQARSFDDQSDWMQVAEEWEQLAILVEQQEKSLLQNEGGRSTDNSKQAAL